MRQASANGLVGDESPRTTTLGHRGRGDVPALIPEELTKREAAISSASKNNDASVLSSGFAPIPHQGDVMLAERSADCCEVLI